MSEHAATPVEAVVGAPPTPESPSAKSTAKKTKAAAKPKATKVVKTPAAPKGKSNYTKQEILALSLAISFSDNQDAAEAWTSATERAEYKNVSVAKDTLRHLKPKFLKYLDDKAADKNADDDEDADTKVAEKKAPVKRKAALKKTKKDEGSDGEESEAPKPKKARKSKKAATKSENEDSTVAADAADEEQ